MSDTNPFHIILVLTAAMIIVTVGFGVVATGLNLPDSKPMPSFPTLEGYENTGNTSSTWAFNETHTVSNFYNYVKFASFTPDKEVVIGRAFPPFPNYFVVQREGTSLYVIPTAIEEPIFYMDGTPIYYRDNHPESILARTLFSPSQLNAQEIINNYNGTYSTFWVDKGSKSFECYVSFSPLPGYSDMLGSWNVGNGFTVMLYGNSFTPPTWDMQLVGLLGFVGQVIGFFGQFAYWMVYTSGLLGKVLFGVSPTLAGALVALIGVVFVGSLFMFLRGNSGGK